MNIKKMTALLLCVTMLTACTGADTQPKEQPLSSPAQTVWRGKRTYIEGTSGEADNFMYYGGRVYFTTITYPDDMTADIDLNIVNADGSGLVVKDLAEGTVNADGFSIDGEGNIIYGESVMDTQTRQVKTVLKKLSGEGELISELDITDAVSELSDGYFTVNATACGSDGNIYVGNYSAIAAFTPEGGTIFAADTGNDNLMGLLMTPDGEIFATVYADGYCIKRVDPLTGEPGEPVKLTDSYNSYDCTPYSGSGETDIYVDNGSALDSLDTDSGELTEILNWVDSDLIRSEISALFPDENGGFICMGTSYPSGGPVITEIFPVDSSSLPEKKEILLSGSEYAVTVPMETQAVRFNMENEEYRIKIKKYPDEEYLSTLNTDILSGNIPDIIITSPGMNTDSYISKGLFADLYTFMDTDSEVTRDKFLPNVLSAFETDGKLYHFTDMFMIDTVLGKSDIFGSEPLTYERLDNILKSGPADRNILLGANAADVLLDGINYGGDAFIDYEAGKCNFNSEEFLSLLEFASGFPSGDDSEPDYAGIFADIDITYSQENTLLMQTLIGGYDDFYCSEKKYFGDEVTAVGYPSVSGESGSLIRPNSGFALSAKSENKEGAWQFLRTLLSPEYQDSTENFPVRVSSLRKNGERIMQFGKNDFYYSLISVGNITVSNAVSVGEIGVPASADIDRINELVTSVSRLSRSDSTVGDIVKEEASAYFAGNKTAEETARLIESRVNIYLSESYG